MENKPKVLIVDDEKDLCEILEFNLISEGFETQVAHSAEQVLNLPIEDFDLLLLDVMMGEMSGYKLASIIRKEKQLTVPIIFMTARTAENDILTGFNVGGDDYIAKPFSIKEMVARIKAVLKRGKPGVDSGGVFSFKGLTVDTRSKTVQIDGEVVNLTRKEFEILALLIRYQGQYIERNEILDKVWNDDVIVTERNVDVNIARLRKKIGDYGRCIKGKSGYGYALKES